MTQNCVASVTNKKNKTKKVKITELFFLKKQFGCSIDATQQQMARNFEISCKQPAFLNSFSPLQVIQNERPRCLAAAYVTARYYLCYLVLVFCLSKGLDICSDDKDAYILKRSEQERKINLVNLFEIHTRQICKR